MALLESKYLLDNYLKFSLSSRPFFKVKFIKNKFNYGVCSHYEIDTLEISPGIMNIEEKNKDR